MIATCYDKSYLKLTYYHLLEVSIYHFQTSVDWKPPRMKSGIERISVLSKAVADVPDDPVLDFIIWSPVLFYFSSSSTSVYLPP